MFQHVIASRPRRREPRLAASGAAAAAGHVVCLVAAIWATLHPKTPARAAPSPVVLTWPDQTPARVPGLPLLLPMPPDEVPGPIAVETRVDVPPIDAGRPFNPVEWLARDVNGTPGLTAPASDAGIVAQVDEAPALLAALRPNYPELLRAAGITGQVIVQAVVDTSGRADPGSVMVIASSHPGFDAAARAFVLAARFRPARVQGRGVRVQVRVPVVFALTR